jgi:hypothetical protein
MISTPKSLSGALASTIVSVEKLLEQAINGMRQGITVRDDQDFIGANSMTRKSIPEIPRILKSYVIYALID